MNAAADRRLLLGCEIALVAVSASIVLGFGRLFVDHSFLPEVATMTALSHALAILVRRAGKGIVLSAFVSLVSLVLTASWLFYADTTRFGLPTWTTRDAARTDIVDAWHLFGEVRAPAVVHPGFVLVAGVAMWLVAFLADWAAFRLWSPVEAVAPAAIVFLFSSLQRAEEHQAISTAAFAGTVLVFVLLHRLARQDTGASWLATEPAKGRSSIVRVGSAVGALAIVTGLVVGPALPGAGEEAVVPWRDIGEGKKDDSRVTVSPLVTIKDRLVNLGSAEAFAVVTSRPDYWRLTSLDRFDGVAWTSSGKYQSADGELPSKLPDGITTTIVQQQFTIEALSSLWLPAAYEPQAVLEDGDLDPSYEAESGTLTVGDNRTTADGATYVVQSQIPVRDPAVLAAAADDVPGDLRDRYTALPEDFSPEVVSLAHAIADPQATPYGKARALQDFFHSGRFTYSLDVANGHGTTAIEKFLFDTHTGYCEQFAGTYAAMARAVGLPARVAVGFTPGQQDADGVYRVKGENAHAWPEVYLAGSGWVRFEPTPGRGAPGDEGYTGQAPQQAQPGGGATAETVPTPTAPTGPVDTAPVDPLAIDPGAIPEFDPGIATSSGTGSKDDGPSLLDVLPLLAVLAGVGVLVLGAIPVAKSVRRHRRHARLRASARGRVDAAWEHAIDALGLLDVPVDPSATPRELARRAATALGSETAPTLANLAELTTAARFGPDEPDDAIQREAAGLAGRVAHTISRRVSWKRRIRRAFDPRPLFPGGETVSPT
jgi:transglutaminase-like putative cysteine protease